MLAELRAAGGLAVIIGSRHSLTVLQSYSLGCISSAEQDDQPTETDPNDLKQGM